MDVKKLIKCKRVNKTGALCENPLVKSDKNSNIYKRELLLVSMLAGGLADFPWDVVASMPIAVTLEWAWKETRSNHFLMDYTFTTIFFLTQ